MPYRGLLLISVLLMTLWSGTSRAETLFELERSTNRNRLVYEADLSVADPIRPYWEMLESDGHREELTGFERAHLYGVKILERGRNGLVFSFRAVSSLRVSVKAMGNKWRAFLEILGEPREVRKMFLQVSGGLFPTLEWLEVTDEGGRKFRYFPDSTEWREQP